MAIFFISINSWLEYYKKKRKRNRNFYILQNWEKGERMEYEFDWS